MDRSLVRKIEDMEPEERDKVRKLLQEKDKESSTKLTWMYKGDKPEKDEYLLGRKIDRHIEEEHTIETDPNAPGSKFDDVIARRADIDMKEKMREDPLFAIKQREEDSKKKMFMNPVKMKQIQKLADEKRKQIERKQGKLERKKRKEERKAEKRVKRMRGRSDSDDSDEDSDGTSDDVMKKYLAIIAAKKGSSSDNRLSPESSPPKYGLLKFKSTPDDTKPSLQRSPKRRSRSKSPPPRRRSRSPRRRSSRDRSRSPRRRSRERERRRSRTPPQKAKSSARPPPRKPISAAEREAKLREMQDNATWRNDQRTKNVKQYKKDSQIEDEEEKRLARHSDKPDFVTDLMVKHADSSTVEDRIKRNRYNMQKSRHQSDRAYTQS